MCYLHNFGGRVKVSATSNFVLIRENDGGHDVGEDSKRVVLRFGKVAPKNHYVMDFRVTELTAFIAFAASCSTLTYKTLVA
jgi:hypothetical protein